MAAEHVRGRARTPHARHRTPRPALSRGDVVDAALHLLQTDGYAALSMRRVAQHLGVGTMSLYWHVADRDELLDLVFDEVIGEQLLEEVPADWREALQAIAHAARRLFERYPWLLDAGPRPLTGTAGMSHVEQSLAATDSMGLPVSARLAAISAVDNYVLGYVLSEHVRATGEPELTESAQAAVDEGSYPRYAALVADGPGVLADASADEFELGLAMLLDGIAVAVEGGRTTATAATRSRRRRHA